MTELQHKETRNVMKQEIQFLPTYKEKRHENSFTTFKHLYKVSASQGIWNRNCGVKRQSSKGSFKSGYTCFLNPPHGTEQNTTPQTPVFI